MHVSMDKDARNRKFLRWNCKVHVANFLRNLTREHSKSCGHPARHADSTTGFLVFPYYEMIKHVWIQGALSSLPRNIPTLKAMLVWTNEKSISVFGCWNARKSLQRKCHKGSSRGWNSIQLPISCVRALHNHFQKFNYITNFDKCIYFRFRLLSCVETTS